MRGTQYHDKNSFHIRMVLLHFIKLRLGLYLCIASIFCVLFKFPSISFLIFTSSFLSERLSLSRLPRFCFLHCSYRTFDGGAEEKVQRKKNEFERRRCVMNWYWDARKNRENRNTPISWAQWKLRIGLKKIFKKTKRKHKFEEDIEED